MAFLDEQAAAADQAPNSSASTVKAMWAVLRILAAHNGSLRAAGKLPKGKPDEVIGSSQLSRLKVMLTCAVSALLVPTAQPCTHT